MGPTTGILEIDGSNKARLRPFDRALSASSSDPVVPNDLIQQHDLRMGQLLSVEVANGRNNGSQQRGRNKKRRGGSSQRQVQRIVSIDEREPDDQPERRVFGDLTSVDPSPRLTLEHPGGPGACRLIDLFCPIGRGTRGMIVSPPKAGKTILLQQIAQALDHNHPDLEVMALLIDERPEEVTDFRRNVHCSVWASSNDHTAERHVATAQLAIERAKRFVEEGRDAVVLLDSLTRLGRAYNNAPGMANSGRTLSGGVDSQALAIPKQLFGAARNAEEGGSLTIVATCLVDTGSRGDQVIFEEFKGTGNMELILNRKVAERRLYPAMDVAASGTRKEDKLLTEEELAASGSLRRKLLNMQPPQQIEQLHKVLDRFETNDALVEAAARTGAGA